MMASFNYLWSNAVGAEDDMGGRVGVALDEVSYDSHCVKSLKSDAGLVEIILMVSTQPAPMATMS